MHCERFSLTSGGHFPGKQGANIIGATFDKLRTKPLQPLNLRSFFEAFASRVHDGRSYTESLSHTISLGK